MASQKQAKTSGLSLCGIVEKHVFNNEFIRVARKEWERCWQYLQTSSLHAVLLYTLAVCLGGPLTMFITFAIMTTAVTLFGFVLLEGTILSLGGVVLAGFLTVAFGFLGTSAIVGGLLFIFLKKIHLLE